MIFCMMSSKLLVSPGTSENFEKCTKVAGMFSETES